VTSSRVFAFFVRLAVVCAAIACARATTGAPVSRAPQSAVDELLAVDRAFAEAAANTDAASAISAMFADDVVMPTPQGRFAQGSADAVAAIRANAALASARAEWAPIRGGISADAQHGFTFGYMKLHAADGTTTPLKYLAYWVRKPTGWRVAAYKRGRSPGGDVSMAMMPPALPARLVAPATDSATIARFAQSLSAAEQMFSDSAQIIGIGTAFQRNGSADAVNMGGPNSAAFVVSAAAIGGTPPGETPPPGSPVSWNADRVLVASSGDLGVTFGMIRPNTPTGESAGAAPRPPIPFFTVWRRASASDRWLYVAE